MENKQINLLAHHIAKYFMCDKCDYLWVYKELMSGGDNLPFLPTLSVKQPWAHLICAGIKDIENRVWKCPQKYIGKRVFIHASGKPVKYDNWYDSPLSNEQILSIPDKMECKNFTTSAIIGSVVIAGYVINHEGIWEEKTEVLQDESGLPYYDNTIYNWVLANPVLFDEPITDIKGKLKFWDCSKHIAK